MLIKKTMNIIADHIKDSTQKLDDMACDSFIQDIIDAKRIYLLGVGRSGFVCRAFAMRLMHLGLNSYVIGDATTPPIQEGDIVVAVSGSGTTDIIVKLGILVRKLNLKLTSITSDKESPLAQMSDLVILMSGKDIINDHDKKLVPLGTIFEIVTLIFLDSVIAELMNRLGITEKQMSDRHDNSIYVGIM